MPKPATTLERMIQRAAEQHGFVRTNDARELGFAPGYLRKLAAVGRLERHAWGLYRMEAIPHRPTDEFHEAVLWAGNGAAIGGASALALWQLADVNPRVIDVVVPPGTKVRKRRGPRVQFIRQRLAPRDLDEVDNIPVVVPRVAIEEAIDRGLDGALIEQAITAARGRQQLTPLGEAHLRVRLAKREQGIAPRNPR